MSCFIYFHDSLVKLTLSAASYRVEDDPRVSTDSRVLSDTLLAVQIKLRRCLIGVCQE